MLNLSLCQMILLIYFESAILSENSAGYQTSVVQNILIETRNQVEIFVDILVAGIII